MYPCQLLCVFLPLLPASTALTLHVSPCLHQSSLFAPSLLSPYWQWNSWFVFPWRKRGTEDGWEDGRQRDGEKGRCSFGLVYLINYVLLLPLATLHLIFSLLLQTHTHAHTNGHTLTRHLGNYSFRFT